MYPTKEHAVKWILAGVLTMFVGVTVVVTFAGFGDVPCQDGRWDAAKYTCVP